MKLILYHRTTIADARAIARRGFEDRELEFPLHDAKTGEEVPVNGVWLADRPLEPHEGLSGDALLEVKLDLPPGALDPFELEGLFWNARFWVVPCEWANEHATVRILHVDASTSGFFDTSTGEPETPERGH